MEQTLICHRSKYICNLFNYFKIYESYLSGFQYTSNTNFINKTEWNENLSEAYARQKGRIFQVEDLSTQTMGRRLCHMQWLIMLF